ncbi:hypothetical protein MPER_05715 [Moniliophthora perniciosa FA553]|nr:hypothetical protein MPER_05715 [Moniliophthora perniciosa FA553]
MDSIETFHIDYRGSSARNSGSNGDGDLMDNLNKYLGPLPWSANVKTLGIYGSSAFPKQLLSALLSSPESNSTIETSGLAFSAIQTLVLLENNDGYGYPPGVGLESFARTLADALVSRMKRGYTLKKLVIKTDGHDGVITEETLVILNEVVEEFEVEEVDWRRR